MGQWKLLYKSQLQSKKFEVFEVARDHLLRGSQAVVSARQRGRIDREQAAWFDGRSVVLSFHSSGAGVSLRKFGHLLHGRFAKGFGISCAHAGNMASVSGNVIVTVAKIVTDEGVGKVSVENFAVGLRGGRDRTRLTVFVKVCVESPARHLSICSAADVLLSTDESSVARHEIFLFSHDVSSMLRRSRFGVG